MDAARASKSVLDLDTPTLTGRCRLCRGPNSPCFQAWFLVFLGYESALTFLNASRCATVAAVAIFAIVALMHLLRLVLGWDATIAGTEIPMWVSIAALVIAGGVAIGLWRENM